MDLYSPKKRVVLVDDDQDCIWLRVDVTGGASCHVGYRSCFYRRIPAVGQGNPRTRVDEHGPARRAHRPFSLA